MPHSESESARFPGSGMALALCVVTLYAPIAVIAAYSFNETRSITVWGGFSLDWYAKALGNDAIRRAAFNSLAVAVFAAVFSTAVAVPAALATARGGLGRGDGPVLGLILTPLIVPEIVTAVALLAFFLLIGMPLGLGSVAAAHGLFCVPFAYLPIRARLESLSPAYEEAARDLYASEWRVFSRVIWPLALPGVAAGATLAFIVSLDDFIITNMVAGPGASTLPVTIYGLARTGFTPEINAVSTLLLALSASLAAMAFFLSRPRREN